MRQGAVRKKKPTVSSSGKADREARTELWELRRELFTTAKIWMQLKSWQISDWIGKMEYYLVIKKNKILAFVTT